MKLPNCVRCVLTVAFVVGSLVALAAFGIMLFHSGMTNEVAIIGIVSGVLAGGVEVLHYERHARNGKH